MNIELRMDRPTMRFTLHLFFLAVLVINCGLATLPHGPVQICASNEFPIRVVDAFGRNITIARAPEKIVSLSPSNTEILWAIGAGSKVVGVTRYCDYPPEVLARVKDGSLNVVGGFTDPNVEVIVSLQPDLILVSSDLQKEIVSSLESKGLTVFALAPKTVADIVESVRLVGRIVGEANAAESLAYNMTRHIEAIVNKTRLVIERPRVYYEVWYDPLMSVGQGTYINDLIKLAGGTNIFSDSTVSYPIVNSETVIEADPQIIIAAKGYMGQIEEARSKIEERPGWTSISAVRNNMIYTIDENTLVRYGPRIVEGLETLALIVHPELFPETGLHRLIIFTSPPTRGVGFEIDGIYERTDSNGSILVLLKNGSHTIRLINNSINIGSNKMEFQGWAGAASGTNAVLSVHSDNDSTLTANYVTISGQIESTSQFNYAIMILAIVAIVVVTLVKIRSRRREVD